MTEAAEAIVFDDIFTTRRLNPDGKHFDKGKDLRMLLACMFFFLFFTLVCGVVSYIWYGGSEPIGGQRRDF